MIFLLLASVETFSCGSAMANKDKWGTADSTQLGKKVLKCLYKECPKYFEYPLGLKAHQKLAHSHFHTKCTKCGVMFPTRASHESHDLKECKR